MVGKFRVAGADTDEYKTNREFEHGDGDDEIMARGFYTRVVFDLLIRGLRGLVLLLAPSHRPPLRPLPASNSRAL